jgi:hypothetical protein
LKLMLHTIKIRGASIGNGDVGKNHAYKT